MEMYDLHVYWNNDPDRPATVEIEKKDGTGRVQMRLTRYEALRVAAALTQVADGDELPKGGRGL